MKKQILTLIISATVLATSPAFAMEQVTAEQGIPCNEKGNLFVLTEEKTPIKHTIHYTHNSLSDGITAYVWEGLRGMMGYKHPREQKERDEFLVSQECSNSRVVLELNNITLFQLQEILPFCKNVVGLKLTNSASGSVESNLSIYPDDNFLKSITTSQNLATLEYLQLQEWIKITIEGASYIAQSQSVLPELKYIHFEADDYPGFLHDEGPEIYKTISPLRPDLKLTSAAPQNYKEIWQYNR